MFEEQMTRVLTALAFIIPGILLLRWFLTRSGRSPDDLIREHRQRLEQKYARGEISESDFQKQIADLDQD